MEIKLFLKNFHSMNLTRLAWKQVQELFKMGTSGQLDAISSISHKKNSIKAFQTAASSDRTRPLFAPVQLVTRGASLLAVDGSTDLSAHGFRSSGVRNVAINQLLLSIATVEVESVG